MTWSQGWRNASAYVEAVTYEDAIAKVAPMFADAWKEADE